MNLAQIKALANKLESQNRNDAILLSELQSAIITLESESEQ